MFGFNKKWQQVCICKCGYINKVTRNEYQRCKGCKYYLKNSFVRKTFRYARKAKDGTWEFKEN